MRHERSVAALGVALAHVMLVALCVSTRIDVVVQRRPWSVASVGSALIWLDPQTDLPATPDVTAEFIPPREWSPPQESPPASLREQLDSTATEQHDNPDDSAPAIASMRVTDYPDPWLMWTASLQASIDHAWESPQPGDKTATYFACSVTLLPRNDGAYDMRGDDVHLDGCTSQSSDNQIRRDALLAALRARLPLELPDELAQPPYITRPIRLSFERGDPDNPPLDALR